MKYLHLRTIFGCLILIFFSGCEVVPEENGASSVVNAHEASVSVCDVNLLNQASLPMGFNVYDTSPAGWTNYFNYITAVANSNNALNYNALQATTLPIPLRGGNKFRGGVLSQEGNIFFLPQTQTLDYIYVLNPNTLYFCRFSPHVNISGVWAGGTVVQDGRIISFPISGNQILEITPSTLQVQVIGHTQGTFSGQILASNGYIYATPSTAHHIIKFNPANNTYTTIGNLTGGWYSSALAPNGKIFAIPLNTAKVLRIDPTDDSYALIGDSYPSSMKWAGSILAPNGKIYAAPDDAQSILEIDPDTETTRLIGNFGLAVQKWSFGFLGPDGKVYFAPDYASTIMQFDPTTEAVQLLGNLPGDDKWNGVVQAGGKYYAIPDKANEILIIDFAGFTTFDSFQQLSPFVNKY